MPWSPLRRGLLSGKYSRESANGTRSDGGRGPNERELGIIDVLNDVAAEAGATPAATALAWVQSRPGVSSTVVGARHAHQFDANIAALDVALTEKQVAALDEASTPALSFPVDNNRALAPMLQFAGATVDGRPTVTPPHLLSSPARY
jgi:aryl-alcohol dehydrogenase-like predicted oxidoreductase